MNATRDRILAAARVIFDSDGLDRLSMRRVAEAVGITPMAIYKHFADKAALADALMLDGFASWEARVFAIDADDPIAWLSALMAQALDFALAEPHRYEAAFLLPAAHARRYPADFAEGRSPVMRLAHGQIERAKAQGRLKAVSALDMALSLSALSQGLITMYRAGRFSGEAEFRDAYGRAVDDALSLYEIAP